VAIAAQPGGLTFSRLEATSCFWHWYLLVLQNVLLTSLSYEGKKRGRSGMKLSTFVFIPKWPSVDMLEVPQQFSPVRTPFLDGSGDPFHIHPPIGWAYCPPHSALASDAPGWGTATSCLVAVLSPVTAVKTCLFPVDFVEGKQVVVTEQLIRQLAVVCQRISPCARRGCQLHRTADYVPPTNRACFLAS